MNQQEEKIFDNITDEFSHELIHLYELLLGNIKLENYEKCVDIKNQIDELNNYVAINLNARCGLELKKMIKFCKEQSEYCHFEVVKKINKK